MRGLLAWFRTRGGAWEQHLGHSSMRVTAGRQLVSLDNPIDDNSEIALLLHPLAP